MTRNIPYAGFLIRPATEADESATVALWRACGLIASYNDPQADFRFARAGAASDVLVAAERAGRVVGSVMVGHDGHRGWLYYVAADPGARSRGIGRTMVRAAEEWLRGLGVRKAQLLVRRSNAGVTAFYERLGFGTSDVIVMQRWLDGREPSIQGGPELHPVAPALAAEMDGLVPLPVAEAVIQAGQRLDARGWVPATAGNISQRLGPDRIAITRSGVHKGFLSAADVIVVGLDGVPEDPAARPSAETLLHCQIYDRFPETGAVLHGHSVAGTVLSMQATSLRLHGYELQKAFENQTTHDAALDLPVVDNDQDIARLAAGLAPLLDGMRLGYLIRGHGTYVWGPNMQTALARFESLEFLLSCELERRRLP